MIRVFVGTPANNEDLESQAVLEYSLRKFASEPIELVWMKLSKDPDSFFYSSAALKKGWLTRSWATPFSGLRWGIPALCNFEGRAIYLDVDMIPMADIAELWHSKIRDGSFCIAKNEKTFCCTLFDCARAKKILPPIEQIKTQYALYAHLKRNLPMGSVQHFGANNWNCLDGENYPSVRNPEIKIVHCTSIPHQPQLRYALERLKKSGGVHWSRQTPILHWRLDILELFDERLDEAIIAGYPPEKYETKETFGQYFR